MAKKDGLHRTGEWGRLDRIINSLPAIMSRAKTEGLQKVGLKAERIAVKHIKNQDLNWDGLNEKYAKYKERKGWSNKTLIRSTEYIENITSFVKGDTAFAGVDRKVKTEEGEDMVDVAAVHEFGFESRNIPERPLWRPTFKETMDWLKKENLFGKEALMRMKRMR